MQTTPTTKLFTATGSRTLSCEVKEGMGPVEDGGQGADNIQILSSVGDVLGVEGGGEFVH